MTVKRRKPFFERLSRGLEEVIAHTQGELTLRTVQVPSEPPEIDGKALGALRARAAMSQAIFAKVLNVSTKTLQSWEQGVRKPSDASRRLIQIFSEHPEIVCRTVGLPDVGLKPIKITSTTSKRRKVATNK
ncbi:MAG: helix-turn-helix domain-containing protein [Planctomycetaceae bacterium]